MLEMEETNILVLIRALICSQCVCLPTGQGNFVAKKITVEGVGHDEKSALRHALSHAVEQGVAEYLKEKGVAKNRDALKKGILSKTDGYVKNHFVISTKKEFGLVKLKVMAEVEMGDAEEEVSIPDWISEEVSEDSRYFNSYLLDNPYPQWE